jgi:hypothetical protein
MTQKQTQKLDEFYQSMILDKEEALLVGGKFRTGENFLTVFDIPHDLWMEIVQENDYPQLWNDASRYLENI